MSGIVGIYNLDGRPVDRGVLDRMVRHVASWSAEDPGIWSNSQVGFGHRMLYTTPESLCERHPFSVRDRLFITADARIDNRQELVRKLSIAELNLSTATDSELILRSYEKWEEDCPEHLLGDFAFAIWDQSRHKLFCARDPMAVKPFFYYHSSRFFIFGSSIAAILQDERVPRKLNELRLAYFLAKIYDDDVITFYKDVNRIPGGHCLVVKDDQCRIWRYWNPDSNSEIRIGSDKEYEEAMREIFFEAVRCRLRSSYPVGSMLSGGLDSSSIVCTARKILQLNGNKPLHTFSAVFPDSAKLDPRIDERRYIGAVSDLDGLVHHNVISDQCTPLLDILWNGPEPLPVPNLYMDWLIFRTARQKGIRVILSGYDGDTIISHGYELFSELARKLRLFRLYREVKAICSLRGWPFWGVIQKGCLQPLTPVPVTQAWCFINRRNSAFHVNKGVKLNREFSDRVGIKAHFQLLYEKEMSKRRLSPRLWHLNNITSGLLLNAMDMIRIAADDSSLDLRFPYFDRRLVEFCLALPPSQKMRGGENRSIMRRAMQGILPPMVRSRLDKGCLSVNFNKGMHDQKDQLIQDALVNHTDLIGQYVDIADLKNCFERFIDDPLRSNEEAFNLFLVVVLVQWLKRADVTL